MQALGEIDSDFAEAFMFSGVSFDVILVVDTLVSRSIEAVKKAYTERLRQRPYSERAEFES